VIHLGDYIYEYAGDGDYGYGASIDRIPKPYGVIYTLYDYRARYATYRTDKDLLLSHQMLPWIAVWDDHEVADNTWRDGEADLNNTEASFVFDGGVAVEQRKMNAVRAYFEWMPIRQVEMDDSEYYDGCSPWKMSETLADPTTLHFETSASGDVLDWVPVRLDHA